MYSETPLLIDYHDDMLDMMYNPISSTMHFTYANRKRYVSSFGLHDFPRAHQAANENVLQFKVLNITIWTIILRLLTIASGPLFVINRMSIEFSELWKSSMNDVCSQNDATGCIFNTPHSYNGFIWYVYSLS